MGVPRDRPGDESRRIADLERQYRELAAAVQIAPKSIPTSALQSPIQAGGNDAQAQNVTISATPAGQTFAAVTSTDVVPVGMTQMTSTAIVTASALNGTGSADVLSAAVRVSATTVSPTVGLPQSMPAAPGGRAQVVAARTPLLSGLVAGQVVTHEAMVWSTVANWPASVYTVIDLQVSIVWFN